MTFALDIKTADQVAEAQAAAMQARLVRVIDQHVEGVARSRDYNNAAALAGYTGSTVPAWSAEAQAFVGWRDQVWVAAYAIFAEVQSGARDVPTAEGLIDELPAIDWPA